MNLILLRPEDLLSPHAAILRGDRAEHLRTVLKSGPGDAVRVGLLDGKLGSGTVRTDSPDGITLEFVCDQEPPSPLPLHLLCALQRPKTLRKILQFAASAGVKHLTVIECWKVDKSYWTNPLIDHPEALREELILGLEQGRDTVLPEVTFKRRFKPFVEDELPGLLAGTAGFVAHPEASEPCPAQWSSGPVTLAVGPEGGFTPYEIEKLTAAGMKPVHLGPHILRTEFAIPALLGRLLP